MTQDVCLTCRFFAQQEYFGEYITIKIRCRLGSAGECRLNPPVVPLDYEGRHRDAAIGLWPIVHASSWCGRHRPRCPAPSVPTRRAAVASLA